MEFEKVKMYAYDYRLVAKNKVKKYSSQLAIIYLIYFFIIVGIGTLSIVGIGGIVGLIVAGPFVLSFAIIAKKVYNEQKLEIGDLFKGFNEFGNSIGLYIIKYIFEFLWSLLFVIPGIIKKISYSMSFYIYNDNRNMRVMDAITESKK